MNGERCITFLFLIGEMRFWWRKSGLQEHERPGTGFIGRIYIVNSGFLPVLFQFWIISGMGWLIKAVAGGIGLINYRILFLGIWKVHNSGILLAFGLMWQPDCPFVVLRRRSPEMKMFHWVCP